MNEYRLTPAAQRDLSSIWDFTEQHWSTRQVELYVTEIREAIERITADPERGRNCDEIREGYRHYVAGSHLVFYAESGNAVNVIRILHQRMDTTRHL